MRCVALALPALVVTGGLAHADDGFDWDPPPPAQWSFRASSIVQGKPQQAPYAGLVVAVDHRLDGRVWGGLSIASMLSREFQEPGTDMPLPPLQTATLLAATARVQLGEWASDEGEKTFWVAWEARAELGTAFVTREHMRSTPAVGSAGLTGLVGGTRTRGLLSLGYAFAFAGSRTEIDPGGIDVRIGVTRSW